LTGTFSSRSCFHAIVSLDRDFDNHDIPRMDPKDFGSFTDENRNKPKAKWTET
jgi:hypothetical protein